MAQSCVLITGRSNFQKNSHFHSSYLSFDPVSLLKPKNIPLIYRHLTQKNTGNDKNLVKDNNLSFHLYSWAKYINSGLKKVRNVQFQFNGASLDNKTNISKSNKVNKSIEVFGDNYNSNSKIISEFSFKLHNFLFCCSFFGAIFLFPIFLNSCQASELESEIKFVNNENFESNFEIPKTFPPLKDLYLPSYQKITLDNGLKILLLEDHELGLVSGKFLVRGGSKLDPENKIGLSSLASVVQRSGGTVFNSADDLNTILENKAASIETSSSTSQMNVTFNCLSDDIDDIFPLFAQVVRYPLMPIEKLELAKSQTIGGIIRRNDDPTAITSREISKILYGTSSPYSRLSTISTIKNINNFDLIDYHNATFKPNESILVVWGDFNTENFFSLIKKNFSDWQNSLPEKKNFENNFDVNSTKIVILEDGTSNFEKGIYVYDKPEMTQGYIKFGELGINFFNPDIFALDILNSILNGFGGKLFDQIRSKEGLAYSVYGGFSPAIEHRGTFIAGGETKIEMIPKFISAMNTLLNDIILEKPTLETLERAKDATLNSFVFNFSNNGSQMSRIALYELFGIDQNFVFDYKNGIENVSAEDVLNAAKQNLHPNEEPVIIVTNLNSLGPDFDKKIREEFDLPVFRMELDTWE